MATSQRNMYTANNSNTYLPSYPPQGRDSSSVEDYKPPAEYDIINSYTSTAVPLPKQSYPANTPYSPTQAGKPALYPPFAQKPSFQSSYDTHVDPDGGGGEDGAYNHYATKEVVVTPEKRTFLQTVCPLHQFTRFGQCSIGAFRNSFPRCYQTLLPAVSTYWSCSLRPSLISALK